MDDFGKRLEASGEYVDGQALSPEGAFVRADDAGKRAITDGPFAETKDLIAGWYVIDVDGWDRAVELAGELSLAPGKGGKPIHEWLEVRPFYAPVGHRTHQPDPCPILGRLRLGDAAAARARGHRRPRPPRGRLRGGRGRRPGGARRGVAHIGDEAAPRDLKGWLVTVAWRRFLDVVRSETARQRREVAVEGQPEQGPIEGADDTLGSSSSARTPRSPRRRRSH